MIPSSFQSSLRSVHFQHTILSPENPVVKEQADALVLAGDIAESHILGSTLESLATLTERPVYFFLGSHDFYRGSVACTCRQVGHVVSVADVKAFVVFSSVNWRMITGTIFILSSLAIREQVAATGPLTPTCPWRALRRREHLCP
jgi:hypothetical protein